MIEDNLKDNEILENNPDKIPENDIGPNENNDLTHSDGFVENKTKHKSIVPKDHPISNVIGDTEKSVITRR